MPTPKPAATLPLPQSLTLGAPLKGSVLATDAFDLNNYITSTTRVVNNKVLNSPITGPTSLYGVLVVLASSTGGSDCIQYFVTGGYGGDVTAFSVRVKTNSDWSAWKSVSLT